jgi:cytochrome P450
MADDIATVDFIADKSLIENPYPYYEDARAKGPVQATPNANVIVVTGYDEIAAIFRDPETFSSFNAPIGPVVDLPFTPMGDDITGQLDPNRAKMPFGEYVITMDPPQHTRHRALLARLFTPARLKQNEAYMWRAADELIEEFAASGTCELLAEFSMPFTAMVIADLLGAPGDLHETFLKNWRRPSSLGRDAPQNPMAFLDAYFTEYIEERRRRPRQDVMSDLAQAKFPDGTTPSVADLVRLSTMLFAAGQDTTAHFIAYAVRVLAERPQLQQRLRDEPDRIVDFIEEALRFEGPVRCDFRLVARSTRLAGVDLPAGTALVILLGAANRDAHHFERPDEFQLERANMREHLAFARGPHTCIGAPLARMEAKIGVQRLLTRLSDLRISQAHHGPPGARRYAYDSSYAVRGLSALHLEFTAAS